MGKTISAPNSFELGEKYFKVGNYQQAITEFEQALSTDPKSKYRDQALLYLGLCHALAADSNRDLRKAEAVFRQLIAEFPSSHYKSQAEFILGLQVQIDKLRSDVKERDDRIKKLSEELKVLKEIDLQRRPSRPE
jgi:TolA-binding protein